MTELQIHAATGSDIGLRRASNQDLAYADGGVFIVCDGMGGGVGGQRASAATVERFRALQSTSVRNRASIEQTLQSAQRDVHAIGEELAGISGTTISGLVAPRWPREDADAGSAFAEPWYVLNIGDSRTYHLNMTADGHAIASSISRITKDHSERQKAIDTGTLMPQTAIQTIPRNIITQCIGSPAGIDPDIFAAEPRGRFIVCSDGVHAEISDERIADIAASNTDPQAAVDALIQAAIVAGGSDNITVIVVDMPATASAHGTADHSWRASKLAEGEDIGSIGDETLDAIRSYTPHQHAQPHSHIR